MIHPRGSGRIDAPQFRAANLSRRTPHQRMNWRDQAITPTDHHQVGSVAFHARAWPARRVPQADAGARGQIEEAV
jgi:hypothetical protein